MKKYLKNILIWSIICAVVGYGVGVGVAYLQDDKIWDIALLTDKMVWILLTTGVLIGFVCGIYF